MKHCLHLKDWSADEIRTVIERAMEIKANQKKYGSILKNKNMIMLFQKGSTRTRLSFAQLGLAFLLKQE